MTRAQIKTLIQAAGHGTDTDDAQNAAIEGAFLEVAGMRDWSWLEAESTTVTVVIGNRELQTLPTDIGTPKKLLLLLGTDYIEELRFMDSDELLRRSHIDRDNDVPLYWTEYNGAILMHPRPLYTYTAILEYIQVPTSPTDDTWVPPFDADFHEVLAWGALRWLSYRQRDWSAYNAASQEFRVLVNDMKSQDGRGSDAANVPNWSGWQRVK